MAISFPLSPPSTPIHSAIDWVQINVALRNQSPFSLSDTIYDYGAGRWGIRVSFDPMKREDAQKWIAFLSALRGPVGTFFYGDTVFGKPIGGITGVAQNGGPIVNGGGQTGTTLSASLFQPSKTVLRAGDMFAIEHHPYIVAGVSNVLSDGSGNASIEVWPQLKAHQNGAPLVLDNWKGEFRLTAATFETNIPRNMLIPIEFTAEEVI